jgi:hypothetical protein
MLDSKWPTKQIKHIFTYKQPVQPNKQSKIVNHVNNTVQRINPFCAQSFMYKPSKSYLP